MTIILIIFILTTLIQLSYWIFYYTNFYPNNLYISDNHNTTPPISIIICVKNEEENIRKNFPAWIAQCISKNDELIIVDDFSTDQTFELIKSLSRENPYCKCIKSTIERPGKKQAIIDGINSASNKYILLTDADCTPPAHWKKTLTQYTSPKIDFVLAYAPFYKKSGFLNIFQRFECSMTALQYVSYANAGIPYMGVGRNLFFRRSIFDPEIYKNQIASGDDDLLVSAKARKENTTVCLDPGSFVFSNAPSTLYGYWKQKIRHISSSQLYKPKTIFFLSLFSLTQIIYPFLTIGLLFTFYWETALFLYLARLIVLALVMKKAEKTLNEKDLFIFTPILDFCLSIYYLILTFSYPFKNKKTWN